MVAPEAIAGVVAHEAGTIGSLLGDGTSAILVDVGRDALALDGSEDGLLFYRVITQESKKHLNGGGMLFYEIGYDQGEAVREIMEQAGFIEVQVVKDYSGLDRVVYGTLQFSFL